MLIVTCQNDGTGDNTVSNYDCEVRVNERVIARVRVEGHYRLDGWQGLLRLLAYEGEQQFQSTPPCRGRRVVADLWKDRER
jgi:hypothetical protein